MKKKFNIRKIIFLSIVSFLCSCTPTLQERNNMVVDILRNTEFKRVLVPSGDFVLTSYQKISDKNSPYVIYIDGDGFVRRSPSTISENPTPTNPITLKLAKIDNRENVAYLARPCQYTEVSLNPVCKNSKYWSDERMSQEIVEVIANAIKKIAKNNKIILIGFSGGGGIAALVAPKLSNVVSIITIAGNLDIEAFTDFHNSNKIANSLNPVNYAHKIKNIPQLHISGAKDKVVPKLIADNFMKAVNSKCAKQLTIDYATHGTGWDTAWKEILDIDINCK